MARTVPDLPLDGSRSLLTRARKVEALIDARPGLFFAGVERIGGYPLFVERAQGAHLWDVDGNRYLDYGLGYGSVILGHAHPSVARAVAETAATLGGNPTILNRHHVELAERVVALSPGAETVTFLKTGSDATGAAVRLARAVTGRPYILRWGMNGWHDWCAPVEDGILPSTSRHTLHLRPDDLDHAEALFARHGDDIACTVLMPYDVDPPTPGYLRGVRDLCRRHGALFVLDEIRTGFRIAPGGAQEHFGIEADLVAYGKALGNGYPISALAGRREVMKHILKVGVTVTYIRAPDAMAAAIATLDELRRLDGPRRIEDLGRMLMDGLDALGTEAGVPVRAVGLPWTPFVRFRCGSEAASDRALRMFCNGMLERGILMSPSHHWFLCTAMCSTDITSTLDAARDVLKDLQRVM